MRRVPEVIDTWFDSGAMSFAQWHYPFENRETLATPVPGGFHRRGGRPDAEDGFIPSSRSLRAWVMPSRTTRESGIGNRESMLRAARCAAAPVPSSRLPVPTTAPFKAVVVNDLVLDAHGVKMSKRLGNIVDPWTVIPKYGADAVRLFLVSSSQVWKPRAFDEAQIREGVTQFLVTLKNIYSGMFAVYANFGWEPSALDPARGDRPAIDRWMSSRLTTVEGEVDDLLQAFDATAATKTLMTFLDRRRVELVRAPITQPVLRGLVGRQPRGVRDAARGARRDGAAPGAARTVPERLAAPRADRTVGAPRAVSPRGRPSARFGARTGNVARSGRSLVLAGQRARKRRSRCGSP